MSEEKKQRLKEYQRNHREPRKLENIFHKCRYDDKNASQNCYRKDIFRLFFYQFLKGKMVF